MATACSTRARIFAWDLFTACNALEAGGENALVVRREHGLRYVRRAVWDQHYRPSTHMRGHRRGRDALVSDLFAHPPKDPSGDSELVSLGPHLRQLLGQL